MPLKLTPVKRRSSQIHVAVSYRVPMQVLEAIQYSQGGSYPICPRCDCSLDREYVRFCDRCGQRLSWKHMEAIRLVYPSRDRARKQDKTIKSYSKRMYADWIIAENEDASTVAP